MKVELMGPLGTKPSHKGDRVFARVAEPVSLKGDTVEGTVKEVRSGGKLHGNSVLNFTFETLQHGGQPETVRGWMVVAELWKAQPRKLGEKHFWRPRRSGYGELVQWDTSN